MKRRSKLLIFGVCWVGLFGVTYIALAKQGAHEASTSIADDPEAEAQQVLAELHRLPTVSSPTELIALEDADSAFSTALNDQLFEQKSSFRPCKSAAMVRSTRKTEYFEVSFSLLPKPATFSVVAEPASREFDLTDIQLERSTMQLAPAELECVVQAFEGIEVLLEAGQDNVPTGRIRFAFCFTNRTMPE